LSKKNTRLYGNKTTEMEQTTKDTHIAIVNVYLTNKLIGVLVITDVRCQAFLRIQEERNRDKKM